MCDWLTAWKPGFCALLHIIKTSLGCVWRNSFDLKRDFQYLDLKYVCLAWKGWKILKSIEGIRGWTSKPKILGINSPKIGVILNSIEGKNP